MSLIEFNPLQQLIELLNSNGWDEIGKKEGNYIFRKVDKAITFTDNSSDTVEMELHRDQKSLGIWPHTSIATLLKDFILH